MRTGANALTDSAGGHNLSWTCDIPRHLCESVTHARLPAGTSASPCQAADAMSSDIPRVYLRYTPAAMQALSVTCGHARWQANIQGLFPHQLPPPSLTTSFGVSTEGERRLRAAALRPDVNDIKPDPGVWS